jgi:hypothetical protein
MNDVARLHRFLPSPIVTVVLAGTSLALAAPVAAHHALEAMYDTSTELVITATLAKIDWINPHAWMRFDMPYPDGHLEKNVLVETLSVANLRQLGVDKAALVLGGQYQITYYPTRDGSPGGFMTRMVLPSGSLIASPADVLDDSDS